MLNSLTLKNSHYFTIPDPGKGLPSFESLIQALSKNYMKRVRSRGINKSNLELFTTCIKPPVNDAHFFSIDPSPPIFPVMSLPLPVLPHSIILFKKNIFTIN